MCSSADQSGAGLCAGLHVRENVGCVMEQAELELAVVSLEIMEFVPDILALGVTAGSFVVLAAGLLVGCFKTLIKIMGR